MARYGMVSAWLPLVAKVALLITTLLMLSQPLSAICIPADNQSAFAVANDGQMSKTAPSSSVDYDYSHDTENSKAKREGRPTGAAGETNNYDCIHHNSAVVPVSYSLDLDLTSESTTFSGHMLPASLARLYDHEYYDVSFCVFTECFLAPGSGARRLNTYGDALQDSMGAGRLSHADEYSSILKHADDAGVDVSFRKGTLAYEPSLSSGKPGRLILDPDASIGALRHEYRHMLDDIAQGHPGFRLMADSDAFWRLEFRGYMEEIRLARQIKDFKAGRSILKEMRARRLEILGR